MDSKKGLMIAALGVGAYYLLTKSGTPTFYDINGKSINAIVCGASVSFDVPGYKRVWMSQLKDGQLHFDAPFDLPMPLYIMNCSNDVGVYDVAVYEIDANDVKGKLIGQTTFVVYPSGYASS